MPRPALAVLSLFLVFPALALADPPKGPFCSGEYADDLSALPQTVRDFEQKQAPYTFCIRTTATYECPSYGPDGKLRQKKRKAVAHGTGFAYRQQGGETLLITNEHVAEWPAVTDDEHPVEDVPSGCKRVQDALRIVDGDSDSYERDDIALGRVVVDATLDIAVLKAKAALPTVPWKIGHSAGLRERNVVDVRGFPLGVLKATNVGKVISAYDHDDFKEWDHDDFVIDALLSQGSSGSPVFAVSCKTGEFELVGVYHAAYSRGSALNVVVGIDQVRDLMTALKKPARKDPGASALDAQRRAHLEERVKAALEPYFPFGPLIAALRLRPDGALVYELLSRDFPLRAHPVVLLEDLPPVAEDEFGAPGRVWFGNRQGLKGYARSELDGEVQATLTKLLEALRHDAVAAFELRAADHDANATRERFERAEHLARALQRASAGQGDLSTAALELAEKLGPTSSDAGVPLEVALRPPPPGAAPAAEAPHQPEPASAPVLAPVPSPKATQSARPARP
ncbi:MAG TPA: serine protease [Myxococcaceae bacterium]|nr:serine protease [Myxococcaceae bacterium]